jgi:phage host-nuclease inhibitor protein Gam
MEDSDAPGTPSPTPIPADERPFSPTKPSEPPAEPTVDPEQFQNLKEQVTDLEREVRDTEEEIRDKIRTIEKDLTDEGVSRADLQWRMTAVEATIRKDDEEEDEEEGWREVRRKDNRRGKGANSHGYRTRYAVAHGHAPPSSTKTTTFKAAKKELNDLKVKATRMEERMDGQQREMERLSEEFIKVEALTLKVAELGETIEKIRTNQTEITLGIAQDVTRLTARLNNEVGPHLKGHDIDIATLVGHYQMLHSFATGLLAQQSTSAPAPFTVNPKIFQAQNPNHRPTFLPHNVPPSSYHNQQANARHPRIQRTPPNRKAIAL